ncbi:DUF1269 domain-containing protein [Bradyrhizobium sp. RT9b]|uniref:DUF1269 domain-containing protein n=1 Tax=Bradyrhizobium sp. RT9b TaxID=3156385 RepID=UPI003397F2EB
MNIHGGAAFESTARGSEKAVEDPVEGYGFRPRTEVDVIVFNVGGPVGREGPFKSSTKCPSEARVVRRSCEGGDGPRNRFDDKWMKETAAAIQPGTAALFVLVRKMTADKVLEGLKGEGGTVLKTSLDHTKEAALQAALADVRASVTSPPEPYSLSAN